MELEKLKDVVELSGADVFEDDGLGDSLLVAREPLVVSAEHLEIELGERLEDRLGYFVGKAVVGSDDLYFVHLGVGGFHADGLRS